MVQNDLTTNNQDEQNLDNKLSDLLAEAEALNQEIDTTNKDAEEKLESIDMDVSNSIKNIEGIHSDLDKAEKDANDELDTLILQQIEEDIPDNQ